jgi:hypothetical protein
MSDEYPACPVCGSNSGQGCTADCTAAEITKLRTEVFWLRQGMSAKLSDHMNGTPCAEGQGAEIAKLRAELVSKNQQFQDYARRTESELDASAAANTTLQAEVERLKNDIAFVARWAIYKPNKTDGTAPSAETALETIANHTAIRAALQQEPHT